jgi:hypothetical protein
VNWGGQVRENEPRRIRESKNDHCLAPYYETCRLRNKWRGA